MVIAREVTKIHEEFLRGRATDVLAELNTRGNIKGEITLLIGKAEESERKAAAGLSVRQRLQQIMAEEKKVTETKTKTKKPATATATKIATQKKPTGFLWTLEKTVT